MIVLGIVVFAALFLSGLPMYMAFAIGGLIIIMFHTGFPIHSLAVFFFDSINSYLLLGIPLYILAGQFLLHSGMGKALVDVLASFTRRVPGGIGAAAVISSAFMGALCGDAFAVMGSVGLVLFPAMVSANYDRGYGAGVLCSSCQLGVLIPPSLVFIVYGYLTKTSVAHLFIAGILPGLLLMVLLSTTAIILAKRRKFPLMPSVSWKERKDLFVKALPALFMPVIVLGGIYGGIFTPTEAGSIACVYTLIVGAFIYRGLNWKNIWAAIMGAAELVSVILALFCGVMLLNRAFMVMGLPQTLGNLVVTYGLSKAVFLISLCLAFIILGIIMDAFATVALIPTILPAATMLGIDPIQLGVIFVVANSVGGMTPPAAGFVYFASKLFNVPTIETIRGVLPFLATTIIGLFILAIFPPISSWLPSTMLWGG